MVYFELKSFTPKLRKVPDNTAMCGASTAKECVNCDTEKCNDCYRLNRVWTNFELNTPKQKSI